MAAVAPEDRRAAGGTLTPVSAGENGEPRGSKA